MDTKIDEIKIEGKTYVPKDSINKLAETVDGLQYVIIRSYVAGVHAGYLKSRTGSDVELVNSRRVWHWEGANELNDMAVNGLSTNDPQTKISCVQPHLILLGVSEIHDVSEKSRQSIEGVKEWIK